MSSTSNPTSRAGTGATDLTTATPVRPRGHVRDDVGLLVIRLGLAAVMIAHGAQKAFLGTGLAGTQQAFAQMGIPYPDLSAIGMIVLELGGGLAILFGLLTPLVGVLYAAAMAGAIWFVHLRNGFFVATGGYELAGLVGVISLALAIGGAGRLSLDRLIFGRSRRRRVREARESGVDA